MYEIYLKKNEEKRIIAGHPWVYANEVAGIEGKDKNGALVSVFSNDGKFIGKGYINHLSKILVRIFIRDDKTVGPTITAKASVLKTHTGWFLQKATTFPR